MDYRPNNQIICFRLVCYHPKTIAIIRKQARINPSRIIQNYTNFPKLSEKGASCD